MKIQLPIFERRSFSTDRRPLSEVLSLKGGGGGPSRRGNSFWRRVRMCPREHALRSEAKLAKLGDYEALTVGLAFHYALEMYYRTVWDHQAALDAAHPNGAPKDDHYFWGNVVDAERTAWTAIAPMATEPNYDETYPVLERMLLSYFHCHRRRDRWRVIAVEETLEYSDEDTAEHPISYSARIDLVVEDYDPHYRGMWIVEHKSAKVFSEDLLTGYQLDQQILGQAWLLERCVDLTQYPMFKGVRVNLTSKHKLPRHARPEVTPSQQHLREFERSLRAWNLNLSLWRALDWPKALGNCTGPARYFSVCEYFEICHGQPEATVEDVASRTMAFFGYDYLDGHSEWLVDAEERA